MSSAPEAPGLFDEPLKGAFVTERLSTDLKQQIESGKLAAGSLVKPVRELMKQYRISYNSVRKALKQLSDAGYLTLEQGRGTFVKGAKVPRGFESEPIEVSIKNDVSTESDIATYKVEDERREDMPGVERAVSASQRREGKVVGQPAQRESVVNQDVQEMPAPSDSVTGLVVWVTDALLHCSGGGLDQALHVFQTEALREGWTLAMVPDSDRSSQTGKGPAGRACVVWGPVDSARLEAWLKPGRICVSVGFCPPRLEISAVMAENFAGAHELTRQMLRSGHRQIAFLHAGVRSPGSDAAERLAGCRVALEEAGQALADEAVLECPADAEWLADRLMGLKPRPTAVLVSEQPMAERLIGQLKERGLGVPRAFSVACFGLKDGTNPLDITSARVDWRRAGASVLSRLRELLSGAPNERLRISLPVELHEGSTLG